MFSQTCVKLINPLAPYYNTFAVFSSRTVGDRTVGKCYTVINCFIHVHTPH